MSACAGEYVSECECDSAVDRSRSRGWRLGVCTAPAVEFYIYIAYVHVAYIIFFLRVDDVGSGSELVIWRTILYYYIHIHAHLYIDGA